MQGKRIVVTGGFGFLGAAVGRGVLAAGGQVALIGHAQEPKREKLAGAVNVGGVDLSNAASAEAGVTRAAEALGGLDGLVNAAGGFVWGTLAEGALENWDRMHRMNLSTAVHATRAALPHLLAAEAGRVVNVGAAGALKADGGFGPYAASKSAVMRFTESLADELKPTAVTVNAVLPSIIDIPANRESMGEADAHKWVKPDDLAAVIVFLLSDAARAVTGALVPVMGRV